MQIEWIPVIGLAGGMLIALILPGYFWLRSSIRSSLVAVSLAPAFSLGVVTLTAQAFSVAGIPWTRLSVFPTLIALSGVGVLVWLRRRHAMPESSVVATPIPHPPLTSDAPAAHAYRVLSAAQRSWVWVLVAAGWLLAALPTLVVADPSNPQQQWDAVFHVNGVWHLLQHHDAGWFTALAPMYDGHPGTYYPAAWHILVALFATPTSVTQAAHASSLAIMAVWVMGCTALTSVLVPWRSATMVAPIIAGMTLSMPADALTMYVQWPHATGVAILPGAIAGAIVWGRRLNRASEQGWTHTLTHLPLGVFLVVGLIGMAHAHASSVFGAVWTLLIPCVAAAIGVVRNRQRSGLVRGAAAVLALLWVLLPIWVLTTPQLQGMGDYARTGIDWSFAIKRGLIPLPPFSSTIGLTAASLVFTIMTAAGAIYLVNRRNAWLSARDFALTHGERQAQNPGSPQWERTVLGPQPAVWLIGAYAIWAYATFLAYSPEDTLRTFWLSPWYMDPRRIMGVENMVMVPLIAIGFTGLVTWLQAHRIRQSLEQIEASGTQRIAVLVGLWLVVVSVFGAFDSRIIAAQYAFDPDNLGKPGMLTSGELAMVKRIPHTLPADAHVLGDPIAGAAYVESIGQRHAFFPQLTTATKGGPNAELFLNRFSDIHTDPAICQALRDEGIEYVYLDADGDYYSFPRSERAPGLYNVDTSRGFVRVDSGDNAAIYRITACD